MRKFKKGMTLGCFINCSPPTKLLDMLVYTFCIDTIDFTIRLDKLDDRTGPSILNNNDELYDFCVRNDLVENSLSHINSRNMTIEAASPRRYRKEISTLHEGTYIYLVVNGKSIPICLIDENGLSVNNNLDKHLTYEEQERLKQISLISFTMSGTIIKTNPIEL